MSASAEDEVLFERRGRAGVITLNRTRALNAVTLNMVHLIDAQLRDWEIDAAVERVVLRAAPGRAFSAGGDIRAVYDWKLAGDPNALRFYHDEYLMNRRIKRFPKPYISLIDGIVMGGGVGVSVHGSHRVVGDNALFAMPETGIGFFPDVGGTYFLPRLPGETGMYLGLTGARVKAADMLWAGIATHHVSSADLETVEMALCEADDIDSVLTGRVAPDSDSELSALSAEMDSLFSASSLDALVAALTQNKTGFAAKTLQTLATKSPTSLRVVFRQLREGRELDFEDCMKLEYRLVSRFVEFPDLFEGIRAVVVDKDQNPHWRPENLDDVEDDAVDDFFAPLEDELTFPR